jgi:hypothetical protein
MALNSLSLFGSEASGCALLHRLETLNRQGWKQWRGLNAIPKQEQEQ